MDNVKITPAGSFFEANPVKIEVIDKDGFTFDVSRFETITFKTQYEYVDFTPDEFIRALQYLKEFREYFPMLLDIRQHIYLNDNVGKL